MNVIIQTQNHPVRDYESLSGHLDVPRTSINSSVKFKDVDNDSLHQMAQLPEVTPCIVSFCCGKRELIPLSKEIRFLCTDNITELPFEITNNIVSLQARNIWVIHSIKSIFSSAGGRQKI